jgi:hypothetical protein
MCQRQPNQLNDQQQQKNLRMVEAVIQWCLPGSLFAPVAFHRLSCVCVSRSVEMNDVLLSVENIFEEKT